MKGRNVKRDLWIIFKYVCKIMILSKRVCIMSLLMYNVKGRLKLPEDNHGGIDEK